MIAFKIKTFIKPTLLLIVLTCTLLNGAHASTCITAGRMDTAGWAPQFKSVRLLNEAGRVLVVKNKSELMQVKAVELKEAALLSVVLVRLPGSASTELSARIADFRW